VKKVRKLVLESVAALPNNAALLLSGGIDSAAIAAAACHCGKRFRAFTFSVSGAPMPSNDLDSDLFSARLVAKHLDLPLTEISLSPKQLIRDLPLAVLLCETHRGTIVDPGVALIATAKRLAREGYTQIWMGEPADDLFGALKFVLRFFRGPELRSYLRRQIERDSPNEMAVIQNIFAHYGISVCYAYWTPKLLQLGYNLPFRFRVDRRRLMKRVLREAFRDDLPEEIVQRPKQVPRDATGVRAVLEEAFGKSRERYRPIFKNLFGRETEWPSELRRPHSI
jgi:asparagine synthase (glutamine-hydrolysing)